MPRDHLPFFLFYPADWTQDVQTETLEVRGAWITIVCSLHVAPERGRRTFRIEELEQLLGPRVFYLLEAISRLADVTWTDGIGNDEGIELNEAALITISSRRMIRDEQKRILDLERSRRYEKANPKRHLRASDGNPTVIRQPSDQFPTDRSHKSEVISHISGSGENVKDNYNGRNPEKTPKGKSSSEPELAKDILTRELEQLSKNRH